MQSKWLGYCLAAALPLLADGAGAQEAFTRQAANVRAGPDRAYPLVAQLGPGAPLRVVGCLEDWTWCDVAFDDNRGWVYGPFLLYGMPDDRVPLYVYGPSLGIAVIGFTLGGYWDEHYRQRPWYSGREQWAHRDPPPHRIASGLPAHAVYTPGSHVDRGAPLAGGRAPVPPQQQHAPQRPQRAPDHAAPVARPAPERENARSSPPHAQPAAQREVPREVRQEVQHAAPREPQRAPAQEREGGAEKGGDRSPREEKR